MNSAFRLRVTLVDVDPLVWRRVLVAGTIRLPLLHQVFQVLMGWDDYHLHAFEIRGERYGVADADWGPPGELNERGVRLIKLVGVGDTFTYSYDFGDNWCHLVEVEAIEPVQVALAHAACLDGARACPPEDVGGSPGYAFFREAIVDSTHEEHAGYMEWSGGDFDPEAFNLADVNTRLRQVR